MSPWQDLVTPFPWALEELGFGDTWSEPLGGTIREHHEATCSPAAVMNMDGLSLPLAAAGDFLRFLKLIYILLSWISSPWVNPRLGRHRVPLHRVMKNPHAPLAAGNRRHLLEGHVACDEFVQQTRSRALWVQRWTLGEQAPTWAPCLTLKAHAFLHPDLHG